MENDIRAFLMPQNRDVFNNNPLNDQNNRQAPLHRAADSGQVDNVRNHLNGGADIEARGNNHQTPLHFAVMGGHEEVVSVLLNQGASTGVRNNNNQTPIHLAASHGNLAIVRELLNHGADSTALDNTNRTPTQLANANGYNEVVDFIEAFEAERAAVQNLLQIQIENQNQLDNPILDILLAHRYPQAFPDRVPADIPFNRRNRRNIENQIGRVRRGERRGPRL